MTTKTNAAGRALIKKWEGLRLTGYLDGGGVPTIGWGHTGPEAEVGRTITLSEAEALFAEDLAEAEADVDRLFTHFATANQYAALVAFMFNLGPKQIRTSTIRRMHNARDYRGAAMQFERWVFDNGVRVQGLVNRRRDEAALYKKP